MVTADTYTRRPGLLTRSRPWITPAPRASSYLRKMRRMLCFLSSIMRVLEMKPSSSKILAIEAFIRDAGMSTRRCRACWALRMRVSMSAMGSVIDILAYSSSSRPARGAPERRSPPTRGRGDRRDSLPARLDDARNLAPQSQLAEADAAHPEVPQEGPRPPTAVAAVVLPHFELRLLPRLGDERFGRHSLSLDSFARCTRRLGGNACRVGDQPLRKGMFMSASSSRDSSSLLAVVTNVMSMPMSCMILS